MNQYIAVDQDITISQDGLSIKIKKLFNFTEALVAIRINNVFKGKEITTTRLSEITKQKKAKIKRHARELLGPDSIACKASGYSRKLTTEEAIGVIIYGKLVSYYVLHEERKKIVSLVINKLKSAGKL